jgi:transposase
MVRKYRFYGMVTPMNRQDNSAQITEQLNDKILIQEQQIAELNAKVKWYKEQYCLGRQKQFGASSEKTTPEQINLFNEAEDIANPETKEPDIETITYERKATWSTS